MDLQLLPPTETLRETFLRALREFRDEGLSWWISGDIELAERDFAAFVAKKRSDATQTNLWAVADAQFVGRIHVHHELTDALRVVGGHIGYDTVPSFRGRGVATEMLRQVLPVARSLGLGEVLLTCDDTHAASIRVIEKNGGVLRETRLPKRYYWISL